MRHFIEACDKALKSQNWHAALAIALTMPDICASLSSPSGKTNGKKYASWWDKYVGPGYRRLMGRPAKEHVFMSGNDCYALRCAFLHQGLDDVSTQRVEKALSAFVFSVPPDNGMVHRNQFNDVLQLQVDEFCRELSQGVVRWLEDVATDDRIQAALARLMTIKPAGDAFSASGFPIMIN